MISTTPVYVRMTTKEAQALLALAERGAEADRSSASSRLPPNGNRSEEALRSSDMLWEDAAMDKLTEALRLKGIKPESARKAADLAAKRYDEAGGKLPPPNPMRPRR